MTAEPDWIFNERIASDCTIGNQVVLDIIGRMKQIGWSESELFGIHLALEEAIINAIKHGNRESPDKQVHVAVRASLDSFFLEVTDEGQGFDPDDVPDCTATENLEVCSGRGLMLMYHYMDEVRYNDVGNSLQIRKTR